MHIIHWEALRQYCQQLLMTQNLSEQDAFLVADCLVDADLCGVESHGVSRMTIYLKRLETGVVNSHTHIEVLREHPAAVALSACNSMGMVAAKRAADMAVRKARESGCCIVTVRNSNHFGMASYYAASIAQQDLLCICGTNAPPNIAPTGSSKSYVGTNPICMAAPTNNAPIILDMAPSVVAMGKVILAAKLGKPIPLGWALTADGKPTEDPNEGMKGTVVPIGGPKGYGLSLFMDIFSGVLSGAKFGPHLGNMWNDFTNPQDVGHFFIAIDISKLTDIQTFKTRLEEMVGEIKALPKSEGVAEIFVPGEIENNRKTARKEKGIELSDVVYDELAALGARYGVKMEI